MATTEQKFLDYPGLEYYHQQNITTMDEKDVSVLDNSKSYTDSSVQAIGNELGTRIDNLILNAGDSSAECADARVTKDGTVHDTLKNRLDTEYSQLSSDIIYLDDIIGKDYFKKGSITEGKYLDDYGRLITNTSFCVTDYIRVTPNTMYVLPKKFPYIISQYSDLNTNIREGWIEVESSTTEENYIFTTTNNTVLLRISVAIVNVDRLYIFKGNSIPKNRLSKMYDDIENLENSIQTLGNNSFTTENITEGKYLDSYNNLLNLSSFCVSDYIEVIKGKKYSVPHSFQLFINFYDKSKTNISSKWVEITKSDDETFDFIIDGDVCYLRFSLAISSISKMFLTDNYNAYKKLNNINIPIIIKPDSDIIDLLLNNQGKTFYVEPGDYDIIQIYKNKYGADYFENKTSLTGETIEHYGLPLKNGTKLICSPNAKFTCHYEGTNNFVIWGFSAFACGNGFTIDGLNVEISNIKYAIHDDYNTYNDEPYDVVIKNSIIIGIDKDAIGGGLGKYGRYLYENNHIERRNGGTYDMRYHNNEHNTKCVMRFVNNYFAHTLRLSYYGTSDIDSTICYVSNNHITIPIINDAETESATVNNMKVIAWNNSVIN